MVPYPTLSNGRRKFELWTSEHKTDEVLSAIDVRQAADGYQWLTPPEFPNSTERPAPRRDFCWGLRLRDTAHDRHKGNL